MGLTSQSGTYPLIKHHKTIFEVIDLGRELNSRPSEIRQLVGDLLIFEITQGISSLKVI